MEEHGDNSSAVDSTDGDDSGFAEDASQDSSNAGSISPEKQDERGYAVDNEHSDYEEELETGSDRSPYRFSGIANKGSPENISWEDFDQTNDQANDDGLVEINFHSQGSLVWEDEDDSWANKV